MRVRGVPCVGEGGRACSQHTRARARARVRAPMRPRACACAHSERPKGGPGDLASLTAAATHPAAPQKIGCGSVVAVASDLGVHAVADEFVRQWNVGAKRHATAKRVAAAMPLLAGLARGVAAAVADARRAAGRHGLPRAARDALAACVEATSSSFDTTVGVEFEVWSESWASGKPKIFYLDEEMDKVACKYLMDAGKEVAGFVAALAAAGVDAGALKAAPGGGRPWKAACAGGRAFATALVSADDALAKLLRAAHKGFDAADAFERAALVLPRDGGKGEGEGEGARGAEDAGPEAIAATSHEAAPPATADRAGGGDGGEVEAAGGAAPGAEVANAATAAGAGGEGALSPRSTLGASQAGSPPPSISQPNTALVCGEPGASGAAAKVDGRSHDGSHDGSLGGSGLSDSSFSDSHDGSPYGSRDGSLNGSPGSAYGEAAATAGAAAPLDDHVYAACLPPRVSVKSGAGDNSRARGQAHQAAASAPALPALDAAAAAPPAQRKPLADNKERSQRGRGGRAAGEAWQAPPPPPGARRPPPAGLLVQLHMRLQHYAHGLAEAAAAGHWPLPITPWLHAHCAAALAAAGALPDAGAQVAHAAAAAAMLDSFEQRWFTQRAYLEPGAPPPPPPLPSDPLVQLHMRLQHYAHGLAEAAAAGHWPFPITPWLHANCATALSAAGALRDAGAQAAHAAAAAAMLDSNERAGSRSTPTLGPAHRRRRLRCPPTPSCSCTRGCSTTPTTWGGGRRRPLAVPHHALAARQLRHGALGGGRAARCGRAGHARRCGGGDAGQQRARLVRAAPAGLLLVAPASSSLRAGCRGTRTLTVRPLWHFARPTHASGRGATARPPRALQPGPRPTADLPLQ